MINQTVSTHNSAWENSSFPVPKISTILVDAHVHIHHCFNLEHLLDSALSNFDQVSKRGLEFYTKILLTADINDRAWLDQYSENKNANPKWSLIRTGENCSYKACNRDGQTIFIILGSQYSKP